MEELRAQIKDLKARKRAIDSELFQLEQKKVEMINDQFEEIWFVLSYCNDGNDDFFRGPPLFATREEAEAHFKTIYQHPRGPTYRVASAPPSVFCAQQLIDGFQ